MTLAKRVGLLGQHRVSDVFASVRDDCNTLLLTTFWRLARPGSGVRTGLLNTQMGILDFGDTIQRQK